MDQWIPVLDAYALPPPQKALLFGPGGLKGQAEKETSVHSTPEETGYPIIWDNETKFPPSPPAIPTKIHSGKGEADGKR